MLSAELRRLSSEVLAVYRQRGWCLATAESCTGGLVAGALTEIAGSSDVVDRGFITYSNGAKQQVLGVPESLLAEHGAVSEAAARAMAEGAMVRSDADVAVAVTGVAGPGGGSAEKPVGLVHVAVARRDGPTMHRCMRYGDLGRSGIRLATIETALEMLLDCAGVNRSAAPVGPRLRGAQVATLFLGGLGLMIATSIVALLLVRLNQLSIADGVAFLAVVALFPSAVLLAWIYGWTVAKAAVRDPLLGLRRLRLKWAVGGLLAGLVSAAASWLVVAATRHWLGEPFNLFTTLLAANESITLGLVLTALLVGVLLAPLWEEIAFRGALYGWLRSRYGIAASAAISALAHSLLHFDPAVMPALFLAFVWFALLFEWSRNIWVPILAHTSNNALAFVYAIWLLS